MEPMPGNAGNSRPQRERARFAVFSDVPRIDLDISFVGPADVCLRHPADLLRSPCRQIEMTLQPLRHRTGDEVWSMAGGNIVRKTELEYRFRFSGQLERSVP